MSTIADLSVKVGADIGGALSGFSHVQSAMGAMAGSGTSAVGAMGAAVAGAGALIVGAAVAAGAAGVKMAGDLQQSVANISTIKPEIDTSAVFGALNEMQTRVPQSAEKLGESLYNVFSSLDVSTEQGLQLTEKFAKGAVGAMTDAETFGTAVIGVMNAYGSSVEDADHISDVFFNTVALGVVTGQELASSLGPVTQSAKAAGVSIDELGALIAGVTKEGGPAAQNINNLNNLFQKITTKDAQKHINDLGIATKDAQGNFLPILDVMTSLKGKLGGMSESARALALQGIFPDAQARLGAQTILDQLDFVKGALETNISTTGASAAAYEKMSATFNSQTKLLGQTFNSMLTTVGAAILPMLTPLVMMLAQALPGAFAAMQAAATPVIAFLSGTFGPVISALGTLLGTVFGGGGGGGFADGLSALMQTIMTAGATILAAVQTWGQAFVDWISPYVPPMLAMMAQLAGEVFTWIVGQVPGILTTLATWGVAFVDWIAPYIPGALAGLAALGAGILGWLIEQVPAIMATLERWGNAFVEWVTPMIPPALAALADLGLGILAWIGEQIPGILAQLQTWGEQFLLWIPPATTAMLGGLGDLALSILSWMTAQAPGFMETLIAVWIPAFIQWLTDVIPKINTGLLGVQASIFAWINETGPKIVSAAGELGAAIISGIVAGVNRAAPGLTSTLQTIAEGALAGAKMALHIQSPSKRFRDEVGKPMVEGWEAGAKAGAADLYKTVADIGAKTIDIGKSAIGGAGLGDMMSGASGGSTGPAGAGAPIYPFIYPYDKGAEVGFDSAGGGYGAISSVGMPADSASPFGLGDVAVGGGKSLGADAKLEADAVEVSSTGPITVKSDLQPINLTINLPGGQQIVALVLAEPPAVAALTNGINEYNRQQGARGGG